MDVKELLEKKNIKYTSKGKDYLVSCLNPEHPDRHPSMRIDKLSGVFGCYSCGFSGNLYSLFNIKNNNLINVKIERIQEAIKNILGNKHVPKPLDAVNFVKDFRDISKDTYAHFDAFTTSDWDNMEDRVIFPIYNILGDTVAYQGRLIYSDIEPKYKVYPSNAKLPLFPPKVEAVDDSIILVEGLFDMINLYDKGLKNVVCTFGTAFGSVKKDQKVKTNIEKLNSYKLQGINTIYIMYDGDKPGRDAAEKLKHALENNFIVDTIDLPDGVDPGSFTKQDVDRLKEVLYG